MDSSQFRVVFIVTRVSQKLGNIFERTSWQQVYHVTQAIPDVAST